MMLPNHWTYTSRVLGVAGILSVGYYAIFTSGHTSKWTGFSLQQDVQLGELSHLWNSTLGVSLPSEKEICKPQADKSQFQRIFAINMPSRTDRRDAISLAAAVSGMDVDFIEGVGGDSIPEAALPPVGSSESVKLSKGIKGSWRSHMNALHQ